MWLNEAKIMLMFNVLSLNVASTTSSKFFICYFLCMPESTVIQKITGRIFSELHCKFSSVFKDLVGIDSCVDEMLESYLREGLGGVRFIRICGMGGMGKTTLAQKIYRRISSKFEVSSFIANVREETKNQGSISLLKQLLSKIFREREINKWDVYEGIDVIGNALRSKKFLIVLDDVDGEEQLEALVGNYDIIAHSWCNGHSINISACRVWGARARI